MNGNKRKSQETPSSKERILQSAVTLFARHGFAGTGLRELAVAAGVNLAMINYFFGSKKELLKEILDIFFSGYLNIARKELAGDHDLQTKLEGFIRSAVSYFESHRDYLLVTITELPRDDPEIIEHKAKWGRQMIEIVDRSIGSRLADETGRKISPVLLCAMLTSLMASRFLFSPVMKHVRPEDFMEINTDGYTEMVRRVFLHGIAGSLKNSD